MIPSQILLKLMNLRTLSHMQLFKFLNSNSVDISFQTLLFQTIVHSLVVRNFTSFHSAGNSTMWRHHHIMQRLMVKLNLQTIKQTVKQTDKQLFKKAERDGEDPWLALLDHRNTPTEGLGTSPAQRLISRRTRNNSRLYRAVRVEKARGHVLPWPYCKTVAWTGDWTRIPNCTLAEESNVEASYMRWETLRQVLNGQIWRSDPQKE